MYTLLVTRDVTNTEIDQKQIGDYWAHIMLPRHCALLAGLTE